MKIPLLLPILFLAWLTPAQAATYTVTDLSDEDEVRAKIAFATNPGDIVELPAGSATWTSQVTWNMPAGAILRGAGSTSTTGGGDATTIIDGYSSSSSLLVLTAPATGHARVSGITFKDGTGAGISAIKASGVYRFEGPGYFRIDHCRFSGRDSTHPGEKITVQLGHGVFGVADECIFDWYGLRGLYPKNGRQDANYEWTQPADFGTQYFFYIEDSIVNGDGDDVWSSRVFDGYAASRMVVRFCTLNNSCIWEQHGTGHSPDDRGPRANEAYGNQSYTNVGGTKDPNFTAIDMKSGTLRVWGNNWGGVYKSIYFGRNTRSNDGFYTIAATPTSWGYSGTSFNGTGSNWDGGTYNGTDTLLGYPCLDQPGRGQGDLLSGSHPDNKVNAAFGTIRWPRQAAEPIYEWANTGTYISGWGGDHYNIEGRIQPDRDYYQQAGGVQTTPGDISGTPAGSPFTGLTGVGWGTVANRPPRCEPGVAYWVTNEGSWNQSTSNPYGVQQSGADGRLYVATATNTWTLSYTPYTYPHPLRGAAPVAPNYRAGKLRMLRR